MDKKEDSIRINRYLALKGYATRRQADVLIEKGVVTINKRVAKIGDQVSDSDIVKVANKKPLSSYTYLAYHKPVGIVTNSPSSKQVDIMASSKIKRDRNIMPVGRLDKDSSGLILLTNDTRIIEPLLLPHKAHEKEYFVTVREVIKRDFESKITNGVKLSDYKTRPCKVKVHNRNTFSIVLTEGKNRQIRRMCAQLGYTVQALVRVRILHISLGDLKSNSYRELTKDERTTLLSALKVE